MVKVITSMSHLNGRIVVEIILSVKVESICKIVEMTINLRFTDMVKLMAIVSHHGNGRIVDVESIGKGIGMSVKFGIGMDSFGYFYTISIIRSNSTIWILNQA